MKAPALGRRVLPILVALGVEILLGHVCVLPSSAEWNPVGGVDRHASADSHEPDESHAASCEVTALRAAPASPRASVPPCVAVSLLAGVVGPALTKGVETREPLVVSRRAPERSLFLLHDSFLI
jgi:hypothetical protein